MRPQLDPATGNRVDAIEDGPLMSVAAGAALVGAFVWYAARTS
jgi:hypothetical protein